ncbi:MAG: sigma 54-interacting transcriptional regulator, partial [Lentisphaeria bacterium]|nr:sigma 54-interacting transcriptional regulator [Lentisphaeria bacterium]
RASLSLKTEAAQLQAAQKIAALGLSVRQAELLCKNMLREPAPAKPVTLAVDYVAECEKSLSKQLGRGVKIVNGKRKGRFELAAGGTLFLDEIGEIPLSVQVKLLRVLETRSFERLGSVETIQTEVRIVAATNRDLKTMVAEGTFREDLYYRLNVVTVLLPPLRERKDDIPPLIRHYMEFFASENGKSSMTINEAAMAALVSYSWPGNIRELRNCVERMVVLCRGVELTIDNVPANIRENVTPGITKTLLAPAPLCDLEQNEKILIERALNECGGNRSRAAEKLGISRRTLHRKLNTYHIE